MGRSSRRRHIKPLAWGCALTALAAVLAGLAAHGCSEHDARGEKAPARLLVGFVGAGEDDPLWPILRAGAEAQADLMQGLALHIEAPSRTSPTAQAQILRKLHDRGVRAVCVQVRDAAALRDLLVWLRTCGVVVVTIGQAVEAEPAFDHVGWSEQQLGELIGQTVSEALPKGGRLVLLRPSESTGPLHDRYLAIRSVIAAYVGLQVYAEYPCGSAEEAEALLARCTQQFPDLTGWISVGPWPLMIDPVRAEPALTGRLLIAGDPLPATWPALARCAEAVAVGPDYGQLAAMALGTARDVLGQSGAARRRGSVPLRAVRASEVDSFSRECIPPAGPR